MWNIALHKRDDGSVYADVWSNGGRVGSGWGDCPFEMPNEIAKTYKEKMESGEVLMFSISQHKFPAGTSLDELQEHVDSSL